MIIFPQEQIDGIADVVLSKASITFDSPLTIANHSPTVEKSIAALLEIENPNQIDLHYLDAILASTGWNKNDDVFDKYETWKARKTPVDKPFNFMHDGNDIIGHITGSVPISQEGGIVADDCELDDIPDNFDILVSSVIYKHWPEEDRIEEIQELINEINEGKWFVSMECLFPSFDYAIITEDGNQHIIIRNETTAFLTKYLRAYDGEGIYQNCKIGRLLRNFTFSGKGLVNKPANPRSIIFNESILFNGSDASVKMFSETEGNITMADEKLETKISDLEKQIASLTDENKSLKAKAEEEAKKGYEEKIAELEAEIASIKSQLSEKETTVAELQKVKEEGAQALASKEAELTQIKAEMLKTARASKLAQAGVEADKIDEVLNKWSAASDEMFDEIVTLYAEAKKNCAKDKEDMEDMKKEDCSKADEDAPETDKAEANTPEEVEVVEQPEQGLATAGEQPEEAAAKVLETAKASLMKSVFKTTRTKNK